MDFYKAETVLSGTTGELWVNGEKFAEVYGCQAKVNKLKEDVPMCGTRNGKGKKDMGWEGTGSLRFNKVDSNLLRKQVEAHKKGEDFIFTLISKLTTTKKNASERMVLENCSFDDITLIDWEANKILQTEMPYTFDEYDMVDSI